MTEDNDNDKPKLEEIGYTIDKDKLIAAIYEHFNVTLDKDSGLVIFKSKYNLSPEEKIDRMANLLFKEVKDNIDHLEVCTKYASNSDDLTVEEFEGFKNIVIRMLRYWKA